MKLNVSNMTFPENKTSNSIKTFLVVFIRRNNFTYLVPSYFLIFPPALSKITSKVFHCMEFYKQHDKLKCFYTIFHPIN